MKYNYEKFFEKKLKELAKEEMILDVGGGSPFQKGMAKYKKIFEGKNFKTLDVSAEYKPDIVGDIHNLPVSDNVVGAILCKSVLEHLEDPARAVSEMHRALKPGGKVLVYTHFIYPYHARRDPLAGGYKDYFRFTEDGMNHLFRNFSKVEIRKEGGYFRAMGFFMPLQAKLKFIWEPIAYLLDRIFKTEKKSTTCGFYLYAIK